ncbi:cytochrome P450 [Dentipellis sp. KUC8613]|nr:cytochrome P450 [Dentipellis sp. KUC8613]
MHSTLLVVLPFSWLSVSGLLVLTYAIARIARSRLVKSPLHYIPGPPSNSWVTGNLMQLFNAKGLRFHHDLTINYGDVVKINGFFGDEQLYISDPRALQSIVVKDQDCFEETSVFIETNKVIFGQGLVATIGDQHKRQRKLVQPVFAVPHLKKLVPKFYEVAHRLCDVIAGEVKTANDADPSGSAVLDMSMWMSRVALESVGQTILGYSFDPLDSPSNNPYSKAIRELIPTLFSVSLIRQFAPFIARLGSPSFRRTIVEYTPNGTIQKIKNMSDVMYDTARDILQTKRRDIAKWGYEGSENEGLKDVVSVLMKENDRAAAAEKMTEDEIIGQMTVLIFGAQDTSASALSRLVYMLGQHPEVQDKLREELQTALQHRNADGELDYDELSSLPWLDAIIKETLRLYPPVPFVRRVTTRACTVPLLTPIRPTDAAQAPISSLTIPEGTTLFVGIAAANRSTHIWGSDAREWRPERWLKADLIPGVQTAAEGARLPGIYAGMMTFFGGGRSCVGFRFAQMEIKIILATLLTRFKFSSTSDHIVWNLSQIISPSVRMPETDGKNVEKQGLPTCVTAI